MGRAAARRDRAAQPRPDLPRALDHVGELGRAHGIGRVLCGRQGIRRPGPLVALAGARRWRAGARCRDPHRGTPGDPGGRPRAVALPPAAVRRLAPALAGAGRCGRGGGGGPARLRNRQRHVRRSLRARSVAGLVPVRARGPVRRLRPVHTPTGDRGPVRGHPRFRSARRLLLPLRPRGAGAARVRWVRRERRTGRRVGEAGDSRSARRLPEHDLGVPARVLVLGPDARRGHQSRPAARLHGRRACSRPRSNAAWSRSTTRSRSIAISPGSSSSAAGRRCSDSVAPRSR